MKTVVCLGDSITAAVCEQVSAEQSYCGLIEKMLNEAGVEAKVVNAGIGGHTSQDGLARLETDVLAHQPDVVTVMFGTNDQSHIVGDEKPRVRIEDYEVAMREIVRLSRLAGAEVVLLTPPPLSDGWFKIAEVPAFYHSLGASVMVGQYADRVRTIARTLNTPLVDIYQAFVAAMIEGADIDAIMPDGVHPWAEGHRLMAMEMVAEVAGALQPGCG
jgi:lysophospholipase L1-like esterase